MNDILKIFLSLSVSGSILALIMLALRPIFKNRLSQTWQYYIWLVVILRFLLPFTPQTSLVGELSRYVQSTNAPAVEQIAPVPAADADENHQYFVPPMPDSPQMPQDSPQDTQTEVPVKPIYWRDILSNIWMIWLGVSLVMFVHKVASYRGFVRFVRVGARKITNTRILHIYETELAAAKIKTKLPLYQNNQVVSPMLVGIIRPTLVVPALDASDEVLRNILRHELTHYKRMDFLYKWLVQITICLHWFNPLVYVVGKQIGKSCELSCDEMVIGHLSENERTDYGDALIASLESQGNYSDFVVSMTMSENGNIVKERLDMIMNYKKKSWPVLLTTVLLTGLLLCGFTFTGAYAISTSINEPIKTQELLSQIQTQDIKTVNLLAESCNITVRHSVNDQFLYDYDQSRHKVTTTVNGSNIEIKVEPTGNYKTLSLTEMAVIYLPPRLYDNIIVEGQEAGVSLPELDANLHLTNNGGSMTACIPKGFNKTIDFTNMNGSGGLLIHPDAKDYALKVISQGSSVGLAGNFPAFTPNGIWEYQNGNGSSKINLNLQGCSFSIAISDEEHAGTKDNPFTYDMTDPDTKGAVVINLHNNVGQKNLVHSSSFEASAGQALTLEVKSNIKGTVDLFLFSPSNQQQRITFGGSNETKTVNLSAGRWAYNCTGFFDSGDISITGTLSSVSPAGTKDNPLTPDMTDPDLQTSKTNDADAAALHAMQYSHSWYIVEYLLPYMTQGGIDDVVKINNQVNPHALKTAKDYYNLTRPTKTETDDRAYNLMEKTGNWTYSSPLFPYMSNSGIDKVVALYNQKTGKNVLAGNYHNQ